MKQTVSSVVMGANFGDEGKGLITDFEVRRTGAKTVCRFNGGAQAGHTVNDGEKRHVFGHLGSGFFAGADTHLSSKFIINPMILEKEMGALGLSSFPSVSSDARVTTIYDMMLNSLAEISRGQNKHGSCGMGINETVTRHNFYPLTVKFLACADMSEIISMVDNIRWKWVPTRMAGLRITEVPAPYNQIMEMEVEDVVNDLIGIPTKLYFSPKSLVKDGVVFEGAQGLALDEFMGTFPHVTRSMTGLPYAILAASELGIKTLQPTYVTRSYLTRHGAGPLQDEGVPFGGSPVDMTNVNNPWQGSLRYAPLNVMDLSDRIHDDFNRSTFIAQAHGIELLRPTLAVTCLDQIEETVVVRFGDRLKSIPIEKLPEYLGVHLDLKISHESRGPSANQVYFCE